MRDVFLRYQCDMSHVITPERSLCCAITVERLAETRQSSEKQNVL